jgi:signal transduction histidine kinase
VRSRHLFHTTDWAFIVVVAAAYLSLFAQADALFSPLTIVVLVGLGVIYTAIGTYVFETYVYPSPTWIKALYLGAQIALATAIIALGQLAGALWLLWLPLVSHAIVLLATPGAVAVSALVVAIFGLLVIRAAGWQVGLSTMLSFTPGVVFIAIFTQMALNEAAARAEVERLAGDLQEAYDTLARYAVQVEELATEKERTRLAREIHDSLGHYLTAINMQLEVARAVQAEDPAQLPGSLDRAQTLTKEGLQEVRRSIATLRSSPLDGSTLPDLMEPLLDACRAADLEVALEIVGEPRPLTPPVKLALYRVTQEALTNVRKHAQARHVRVTLTYTGSGVALRVADDGVGVAVPEGGFGLVGLRERVQLLGGELGITSAPGEGFVLDVRFDEA